MLFLKNECSTNDSFLNHLGVSRQTYGNLVSTVLRESNTTMVYVDALVQVHMRGGEMLRNGGVKCSETSVIPLEGGS